MKKTVGITAPYSVKTIAGYSLYQYLRQIKKAILPPDRKNGYFTEGSPIFHDDFTRKTQIVHKQTLRREKTTKLWLEISALSDLRKQKKTVPAVSLRRAFIAGNAAFRRSRKLFLWHGLFAISVLEKLTGNAGIPMQVVYKSGTFCRKSLFSCIFQTQFCLFLHLLPPHLFAGIFLMPPLFILRKSRSIYPGDTKRHNGERNTAQGTVFPQENRLPRRVVYIGKRMGEEGLSDGKRKSCRFDTENKKKSQFPCVFSPESQK